MACRPASQDADRLPRGMGLAGNNRALSLYPTCTRHAGTVVEPLAVGQSIAQEVTAVWQGAFAVVRTVRRGTPLDASQAVKYLPVIFTKRLIYRKVS